MHITDRKASVAGICEQGQKIKNTYLYKNNRNEFSYAATPKKTVPVLICPLQILYR